MIVYASRNSKRAIWVLALAFGSILIAALWMFTAQMNFLRRAKVYEGTVIDLEDYHHVAYIDGNGRPGVIRSRTATTREPSSLGERVKVYLDPRDPDNAYTGEFFDLWGFPLVLGSIGIFGTSLTAFVGWMTRKIRNRDTYVREGVKVKAKVMSVEDASFDQDDVDGNTRRVPLFALQALAQVGGENCAFRSEGLTYNPGLYFDLDYVDVYCRKGNPKDYYVDVSFLPEQAPLAAHKRA